VKSYLAALGILGYPYPQERAMHASILTGTPLLLIGKIGEAKTKAAEAIAKLLFDEPEPGEPVRFQKIAADKAQFEDMLGFPNPKSLSEGKIEYATTPISIWDKHMILIDEISRCNPQMQNKFLEIVLERQLMGIPTDIKWVWATMNPLDYPGSQPLDGALAGRMGYVINVAEIIRNSEAVVKKVASVRSNAQTPALSYWVGESRNHKMVVAQSLREDYRRMMNQAGQILAGLEDHWLGQAADYVTAFAKSLLATGMVLDGRRLTMMVNNLISNIAIQTVQQSRGLTIPEVKVLAKEVMLMSIPWQATGVKDFDGSKITQAHNLACEMLDKGDALLYRIVTEQDSVEKAMLLLENRNKIGDAEATNLIASIYEPKQFIGDREEIWNEQARIFALKVALGQLFLAMGTLPAEATSIVAKHYPIKFSRLGNPPCATSTIANYREAVKIADYYLEFAASTSLVDAAVAYFTFHTSTGPFSYNDLRLRSGYVRDAINNIAIRLRPYLPVKVNLHVSSGYSTPDPIELDIQTISSEDSTGTISVGGTAGSLDRFAAVV